MKGVKGIEVKDMAPLGEEFHSLALRLDSFPKTIIHRDFQSQNIMVTKGVPRLIDYQGARMGPPAYDVVSILWDPYSRLDQKTRENLLDYYISRMRHSCYATPTHPSFHHPHPIPPPSRGRELKGWGEEKCEGDFQGIKRPGSEFKESEFVDSLTVCRLQRHMQALGAYGFLRAKDIF